VLHRHRKKHPFGRNRFHPNGWWIAPGPVPSEIAQALARWHREHNDRECAVYQLPAEL
jgi:hypothetical protein